MIRPLRSRAGVLLLAALALVFVARPAPAQDRPIEEFVQRVGQMWSAGDVAGLVDLVPPRGSLLLDTGTGTESVNRRHAAAALRALFSERDTQGVRPVRVTLAGGSPPRGFGELSWSFRQRGAPSSQARTVYVGASWESGGWRVTELRVMQ
jgi:hypothetical protein